MSLAANVKNLARTCLPDAVTTVLRDVRYQLQTVRVGRGGLRLETPNRRILEDVVLPAIAAETGVERVLFVGCRWYTKIYAAIFPRHQYWTIEIDAEQAKFGSPGRHIVASYLDLSQHTAPASFDAIVLNGVLGWGIDSPADTERALDESLRALAPGGVLVIGYNGLEGNRPAFLTSPSTALAQFEPWHFEPLGGSTYETPGDAHRHTFMFLRKPAA